MKKTVVCLMIFLTLLGCSSMKTGQDAVSPAITATGPDSMDKNGTITISGSGFKPAEEINLLLTANDAMQSDIGYALKEPPKADENGNWRASWAFYDFVQQKMVSPGRAYRLTATDSQYVSKAHTMITFQK